MREQNNKTDNSIVPSQIKHILLQELYKVVNLFSNQSIVNEIQRCMRYREQKGLIYSTSLSGGQYLEGQWSYFYSQKDSHQEQQKEKQQKSLQENHQQQDHQQQQQIYLPQLSLHQLILQAATNRQNLIEDELLSQTLKINKRPKPNTNLLNNNLLIKQSQKSIQTNNKQLNESNTSRNSQKDFFQFIKNQKQQKQRRKKLLQKQLQKQLQQQKQKKLQQQKLKQQQNIKKLQEKRNRQKQLLQKRQKQKQLIKKHHSLYSQFQTKLFHLKQKQKQAQAMNMLKRFSTDEIRRVQNQKKHVYKSFQKPKIDEHQKSYLQSITARKQERYKKFEQMRKIQQLQKQKSRIRYHSGYKFQRPQDQYQRKRRQQYQRAKQKRDRIMQYRNRVKSNYLPQVDEQKKTQLLRLVEELQSSRKVKRKMLKNGEKIVQKLQVKDHKQVGLGYLQNVKKQVQKMRQFKKQMQEFRQDMTQMSVQQQQSSNNKNSHNNGRKKHIDYLKQLRESNKTKPTSSAFSTPRNTAFSNTRRSQLSFDQKMKKIQTLSHKLMQKTKQQQMLLKYGKFKTPQQILDKKQMIDKNYLQLVNMKLKMIEDQFQQ